MDALKPLIKIISDGQAMSYDQARRAFEIMLNGEATPGQIGSVLTGLRVRGETREELLAGAEIMRRYALGVDAPEGALDTCGTGGDGSGTYNISTAVSFVLAGAGVPVAKHGNRALSSKSGSSEVLESLGVRLDLTPEQISTCIHQTGMGFMFAPAHHSAMKHVGAVRVELGIKTIFNLLGPLSNPAGTKYHLMGVYDAAWVEVMAETLHALGSLRAWVVHGSDGLDEITTTGPTKVAVLEDGAVKVMEISPADAGLPVARPEDLTGGTPDENAAALRDLLTGAPSAYRDIVVFNAAAGLIVAGKAADLKTGADMAAAAIDDGHALHALDSLVKVSNNV